MDIETMTVEEIVSHLASRGLHGVVALDDVLMPDTGGGPENGGGVFVIGHPTIAIGMADEALRRARADQDDGLRGDDDPFRVPVRGGDE